MMNLYEKLTGEPWPGAREQERSALVSLDHMAEAMELQRNIAWAECERLEKEREQLIAEGKWVEHISSPEEKLEGDIFCATLESMSEMDRIRQELRARPAA